MLKKKRKIKICLQKVFILFLGIALTSIFSTVQSNLSINQLIDVLVLRCFQVEKMQKVVVKNGDITTSVLIGCALRLNS